MAHVATAHCQNGTAYVTVQIDGSPQSEVRDLAKSGFAGLGVEMDSLANSHRSFCVGNYFTYSQAVPVVFESAGVLQNGVYTIVQGEGAP